MVLKRLLCNEDSYVSEKKTRKMGKVYKQVIPGKKIQQADKYTMFSLTVGVQCSAVPFGKNTGSMNNTNDKNI